jgi:periplasmic divalent cation tolerance protein
MQDPAPSRDPAPVLVVLCTCPDEATARQIATVLVAGGLAACVNRVPGIRSLYRWEGQVQDDGEELLVIKTTADRYPAAEAAIRERHPYDLPEIIALPVSTGSAAYLDWVRRATAEGPLP